MTITDTPEVTREQEREAIASVPTGLFIGGEWRTTRATMPAARRRARPRSASL